MIQYFKIFDNHAGYTAYTASTEDFITPNVSICKAELEVHYNPQEKHDSSNDYFTTVAKSDGTISFYGGSSNALSYSTDNGTTWSTSEQMSSVTAKTGDKVLWKGECTPISDFGIGKFTNGTATFDIEGNVMSLLFGDNFKVQTSLVGKDYAFMKLFSGNTKVISAENLTLPATALANQCYAYMFDGCISLTTAPSILPATNLTDYCYQQMFAGCTSLSTAPELPATTVAERCYYQMFSRCTSLTKAPELPATTLAESCFENMFQGCTSLTTAPSVLPATTLALRCYSGMFYNCTSLTTAPVLSATTLAQSCYSNMFCGCTRLTTAPALPATTLAQYCYEYMFADCTSLNSITCLATNIPASNCTTEWVYGVASSGTFTKNASMTWNRGYNGIPNGWTVQDATA